MYGDNRWAQYGATELDIPSTPGGWAPPQRGEGVDQADYIRQLISAYTTPRRRQTTTRFDGGMHFGPSREASVMPEDMETAANLMSLLQSMNAERDLEEQRALAMKVLKQPQGDPGNYIEFKGGRRQPGNGPFDRARGGRRTGPPVGEMVSSRDEFEYPESAPGRVADRFGVGDRPFSRREAVPIGASAQTAAQEEAAAAYSGARANYYNSKAGASGQLNASQLEELQAIHDDVIAIKRRMASGSATEMERDELAQELAFKEEVLRRHQFGEYAGGAGGSGGGNVDLEMDINGNLVPRR